AVAPEAEARMVAFAQGLQSLGWTVGDNLRIDIRWSAGDTDRSRRYAAELLALGAEVILANAGGDITAVQEATRSVPIVFANAVDPVGLGVVASLARPGGNVTGFTSNEFCQSGKMLGLLKENKAHLKRAAVSSNRPRPPRIP